MSHFSLQPIFCYNLSDNHFVSVSLLIGSFLCCCQLSSRCLIDMTPPPPIHLRFQQKLDQLCIWSYSTTELIKNPAPHHIHPDLYSSYDCSSLDSGFHRGVTPVSTLLYSYGKTKNDDITKGSNHISPHIPLLCTYEVHSVLCPHCLELHPVVNWPPLMSYVVFA